MTTITNKVDHDLLSAVGFRERQPVQADSFGDSSEVIVAVLLPCRDEASTVAQVVRDFRAALPGADVYVYDNASTDGTAAIAAEAGAIVRHVPSPGKGNVLRRMFAEVDATVYVIADGDGTYDADAAPEMIRRLRTHHLDMVVGKRVDSSPDAYRRGHRLGNRMLTMSVRCLFGGESGDMLSGYRILSRQYVKSFPAFSCGFETETELTVHAMELSLPFDEMPTVYRERPSSSQSKLRTIPDGLRILGFILMLWKEHRPLRFFGFLAITFGLGAVLAGTIAPRDRSITLVATAFAVIYATAGVILDSLNRSRRELQRALYLAVPSRAGMLERQRPSRGTETYGR